MGTVPKSPKQKQIKKKIRQIIGLMDEMSKEFPGTCSVALPMVIKPGVKITYETSLDLCYRVLIETRKLLRDGNNASATEPSA
ncbi:MAG: hypothetical protein WC473_00170 [Patescibacteria group bacterium]